ncbi:MAG: AraC family transcriptional regulator [Cytophagales bacterium]|nr:AraC family transcriptional regulator [Cytophagales bacterium]
MQTSSNIFFPPKAPENGLVRSVWQITQVGCGGEQETILPKGTCEIIFNLSRQTLYFRDSERAAADLYSCFVNGLNMAPFNLLKKDVQTFVGIQLHAFALKFLFGIPSTEFTDRVVNGFDVCDSLRVLHEELYLADGFDNRVQLILQWLGQKIKIRRSQLERGLLFDLHQAPDLEHQSVRSLGAYYNVSERHLGRLCNEFLGMKAEDFILYRKYLASLAGLHNPAVSLTEVAYASGFYDQSHFIREFKAFTGLTPKQYRQQMSDLPGHLFSAQNPSG